MSKKRKKKNAKARRWGVIVVIELLLIIILIPALYIYLKLSSVQEATAAEVDKSNIVINEDVDELTVQKLKGYKTIALFGLDAREEGSLEDTGSRSDAIMVVAINSDQKEIKLLSVYRDTCVNIQEYGLDKITHAYAYGGAELAMSTLNRNFDLSVTEFASVDFAVLADIIDAVGGLDIELSDAEVMYINECIHEQNRITGSDSPDIWEPGLQHLDGTQATTYARIRKLAGDDFKRASRQRIVLQAILEKAKKADIATLTSICNSVMDDISTTLSIGQILSLAKDVTSYKIESTTGFPFNLTTEALSATGDTVIPADLVTNVTQLHKYLFDDNTYVPSQTVQTISDTIVSQTGITKDSALINTSDYNETAGATGTDKIQKSTEGNQ